MEIPFFSYIVVDMNYFDHFYDRFQGNQATQYLNFDKLNDSFANSVNNNNSFSVFDFNI